MNESHLKDKAWQFMQLVRMPWLEKHIYTRKKFSARELYLSMASGL